MNTKVIDQLVRFIWFAHDTQAQHIRLQFFGGEPLLCIDRIKEIIDKLECFFSEKKSAIIFEYGMTTNITLLTVDIAKYLLEKNIGVLVSLDGPQDIHDKNRGRGTFELVMQKLAYLTALGVPVNIRATINRETIGAFKQIFYFLNSLALPFLWQVDMHDAYTPEDLQGLVNDLHTVYAGLGPLYDTTMDRFIGHEKAMRYCIDPYRVISIRPDGVLVVCSRVDWSLGDIWQGIRYEDQLQSVPLYGGPHKSACLDCLSFLHCQGGCLGEHISGKNLQRGSDYEPKLSFCKIQHVLQIVLNERHLLRLKRMV
jgi:radical SAM protein with 4Fe4S-binding SPASM domain